MLFDLARRTSLISTFFLPFFIFSPISFGDSDGPLPTLPDILSVPAKPMASPGQWYQGARKAMLLQFAETLAFHPNADYYFLARDGEYPYLLARSLYRNNPEILSRLKLLNVSRDSMKSRHLVDYLTQEGLGPSRANGRQAILIDTGLEGSIPRKIRSVLPAEVARKVSVLLFESESDEYPGSNVVEKFVPNIEWLEKQLQHYHAKSVDYKMVNGRWVPIGAPEHRLSPNLMQPMDIVSDLRSFTEDPAVKDTFNRVYGAMNALADAACGGSPLTSSEIEKHLKVLEAEGIEKAYLEDLSKMQFLRQLPHNHNTLPLFWSQLPEGYQKLRPWLGAGTDKLMINCPASLAKIAQ